jgi:hypothetical protein
MSSGPTIRLVFCMNGPLTGTFQRIDASTGRVLFRSSEPAQIYRLIDDGPSGRARAMYVGPAAEDAAVPPQRSPDSPPHA